MLKKLKSMSMAIVILTTLVFGSFPTSASIVLTGAGTTNNPYLISSALELNEMRNYLNASFKLTSNINLSIIWEPVGTNALPFKGRLDGNGFVISNLNINKSNIQYVGLFGYTDSAVITNVKIENANVTGSTDTGGLIGYSKKSTVKNCSISGSGTIMAGTAVGGLIGKKEYGDVSESHSKIDVLGTVSDIGGLIGDNSGIVTKSFSTGDVSGPLNVGGLIGYARGEGLINRVYSTSDLYGTGAGNRMGGLIGRIASANINVEDSFATGAVNGVGECGGLVGYSTNANMKNCFFAGNVTGSKRGGITPSTSLIVTNSYFNTQTTGLTTPTTQARTPQQFLNSNTFVGWNFSNIWDFSQKDYPILREVGDEAIKGAGSQQNPYQITKAEHFYLMEDETNSYFKLMNNIDLNNQLWTPISSFNGVFDGQSYKIKNLKIHLPNTDNVGFIALGDDASINNLTIENVDIIGRNKVGALIGTGNYNRLNNIQVIGTGQVMGAWSVGNVVRLSVSYKLRFLFIGNFLLGNLVT